MFPVSERVAATPKHSFLFIEWFHMESDSSDESVSPEQLQEAVDTIVSQFDYPGEVTIEYRTLEDGTKQTEITIPKSDSNSASVATLKHDMASEHPLLTIENATETAAE
ncbi:hypothetical protein SAMN05216388_101328 [Halorientalis persicus]|uniref:Uncharacterized protein n=2 Tax=Halorientalis persicus TaxID=1367881 RepID=A0A1H8Q1L6_9EURY|nr:hypothetical protein SAMN05216388_101328 [Halorientalis persicus]